MTQIFRTGFFVALAVISYLALAPITEAPVSTGWDKLNHFIAFFCLLGLFDYAFPSGSGFWMKITLLFTYGVSIELVQYFLPLREFSLFDVVANTVGIALYLLLRPLIHRLCFAAYLMKQGNP
jgi:VanZ family protein